ncbi:MAG: polysaccharide deacetylase family protein [Candidatus Woesearchaeota archaeon]
MKKTLINKLRKSKLSKAIAIAGISALSFLPVSVSADSNLENIVNPKEPIYEHSDKVIFENTEKIFHYGDLTSREKEDLSEEMLNYILNDSENEYKIVKKTYKEYNDWNLKNVFEEYDLVRIEDGEILYESGDDFNQILNEYRESEKIKEPVNERYEGRTAYLTFDDGPSQNTDKILDILEEYDIPATFYVNGRDDSSSIRKYKDIVEEGHLIANHTYSHNYRYIYSSVDNFLNDFKRLEDLIEETTGEDMKYARFPGGSNHEVGSRDVTYKIIDELNDSGYIYHDWNVTSGDASGNGYSAEKLEENVVNQSMKQKDAVILMHDCNSKDNSVKALPDIIEKLKNSGYSFDTIDKAPSVKFVRSY